MVKYNRIRIVLICLILVFAVGELSLVANAAADEPYIAYIGAASEVTLTVPSHVVKLVCFVSDKRESVKLPYLSLNKLVRIVNVFYLQKSGFVSCVPVITVILFFLRYITAYFHGSKYKEGSLLSNI